MSLRDRVSLAWATAGNADSPLYEDWLLGRGVQLEDPRLGVVRILAANDNGAVSLPPRETR